MGSTAIANSSIAELNDGERRALKALNEYQRATTTEIARSAGLSIRTAYEILARFVLCSIAVRDGLGSGRGCEVIWRRCRPGERSPITEAKPDMTPRQIMEYRRRYAVVARIRREAEACGLYPGGDRPCQPYLDWLDRELERVEMREEVA